MPIGTGTGKHFEDDFSLALEEFRTPDVIEPTEDQMRDPIEIDPATKEIQ